MRAPISISQEIPERYELKYLIPVSFIPPMVAFLEKYCLEDAWSKKTPGGFYFITSLYLDSPQNLLLHRKVVGRENRLNLRIRSYGGGDQFPYFLEVKQKNRGFCKKYRTKVYAADWEKMVHPGNSNYLSTGGLEKGDNFKLFFHILYSINAGPRLLTQYKRKAFFSTIDSYARVTFDMSLRYHEREFYDLNPEEHRFRYYDHELTLEDYENVVLELKSPPQLPTWMLDFIHHFELGNTGFSKFGSACMDVQERLFPENIRKSIFY